MSVCMTACSGVVQGGGSSGVIPLPSGTVQGAAKRINKKFPFSGSIRLLIIESNKGNFNKCDFLQFINSVRSGHCEYSPRGAKKPGYVSECMYVRAYLV